MRRPLILILGLLFLVGCGSKAVKDATTFLDVKEYQRAKELLELELKTNPKNEEAYLLLGKTNLLMGNEDDATKAFETALLLDKDNREQIGSVYREAGQQSYADATKDWNDEEQLPEGIANAFTYLQQAITYDPDKKDDIRSWGLREAAERAATKKTTQSVFLLSAIVQLDPEARTAAAEVAMHTATEYSERSFHSEAIAYATTAAEWDPKHLKTAATVLRNAGLANKDDRALRLAIKWNPELSNDEVIAWQLVEFRQLSHEDYLKRFPQGPHAVDARAVLSRGITAIYHFDDGRATDANGQHHGSITGAPPVSGHRGMALHFRARSNDHVLVPANLFTQFRNTAFVSATVRPLADYPEQPGCVRTIMRKRADNNDWELSLGNGGKLECTLTDQSGTTSAHVTGGYAPINEWTRTACWYDGKTMHLYVNGTEVATQHKPLTIDWNRNYVRTEIGNNTHDIGRGCGDYSFQGGIDEVTISTTNQSDATIGAARNMPTEATIAASRANDRGMVVVTTTSATFSDGSRSPEQVVDVQHQYPSLIEQFVAEAPERLLREAELRSLSDRELMVLSGSIQARHGKRFENPEMQRIVKGLPWYRENPRYTEELLTPTDRANLATITLVAQSR